MVTVSVTRCIAALSLRCPLIQFDMRYESEITDAFVLGETNLKWSSCGLSGEVRVNATFPDGKSCDATLTDWNSRLCGSRSKLILATDAKCWEKPRHGKG